METFSQNYKSSFLSTLEKDPHGEAHRIAVHISTYVWPYTSNVDVTSRDKKTRVNKIGKSITYPLNEPCPESFYKHVKLLKHRNKINEEYIERFNDVKFGRRNGNLYNLSRVRKRSREIGQTIERYLKTFETT